jgi:hypothetical protein
MSPAQTVQSKENDETSALASTGGIGFYGFGAALPISISWSVWHSIFWAILHGLFSWVYVIYFWATSP